MGGAPARGSGRRIERLDQESLEARLREAAAQVLRKVYYENALKCIPELKDYIELEKP